MSNLYDIIREECSDFLRLSGDNPLIKNLKCDTRHVRKVKVRTKKNSPTHIIKTFNAAFSAQHNNIHGRSIFCNGKHKEHKSEGYELVYVFPINGFKFLFNPNVEYHMEYAKVYSKLENTLTKESSNEMLIDMIEYSYLNNNHTLKDAMFSEKEIIIYNVAYYYAVRVSRYDQYNALLQTVYN